MGSYVNTFAVLLPSALFLSFTLASIFRRTGTLIGGRFRQASRARRELLLERVATEKRSHQAEQEHRKGKEIKKDDVWEQIEGSLLGSEEELADRDWDGIIGFFHPFCNAGGGGERVLWAAIRATQARYPSATCVVYTGDQDHDKTAILRRVKDRFNILLHPPTVHFLYLSKRDWVLANKWPRFTLLGQSFGSLVLAWDAFSLLVPDVFVDTMGYAFALALSSWFFPTVPTGAYVHYPTISTDMLDSLDTGGQGINAGTGAGFRGKAKRWYWQLFAWLYCRVGSTIDVVMTNSSWTQAHIQTLWGPYRNNETDSDSTDIDVVFPPVAVEEVVSNVVVSEASEKKREPSILYIAQFRPEKNHQLILEAFASFMQSSPTFPSYPGATPKLVLIGSVRDSDDATRVYKLRLLARELHIADNVEFICDASWSAMLERMQTCSLGVNGMWNEHFGIGVVEYQAAGLISVVNDSGGPKLDIIVEVDGKPTGYHASTKEEYAEGFTKGLSLSPEESLATRKRARKSAQRFTDKGFADKWIRNLNKLVKLQIARATK
ncbi:glycosyltransferase family 4 protein [Amniculicola lignicola CBS 123094]|uniref:GDP-Man:Man(3)GlcNAc(2)-PP-Dol alpha-1,2-mannosyltransferase n=1 Tax=Amniculicola lignicola CBS 123094 TaxID=1392246 RepID=A0A6A5WNS3_9PLEO|nr:glycosyltransferase family 4 protein [Amniculicola lignicola CBS 123094]